MDLQILQDQVYAAIGIVVLTMFFSAILRLFKRKASNTVVLAGLSGSGKTFLFYQLRDGSTPQDTKTSMKPNADTFVLFSERSKKGKIKPVHIVDVPGDIRLRSKLNEFLLEASAVVFVVDASDVLPTWIATSEYLHEILTKECVVKKNLPLLILCNKADNVKSLSKISVKTILENGMEMILNADVKNEFLYGASRLPFLFSRCHNKITLAESSGLTGDIYELEAFIREHVKP